MELLYTVIENSGINLIGYMELRDIRNLLICDTRLYTLFKDDRLWRYLIRRDYKLKSKWLDPMEEYKEMHIKYSPNRKIDIMDIVKSVPKKDNEIVIHCHSYSDIRKIKREDMKSIMSRAITFSITLYTDTNTREFYIESTYDNGRELIFSMHYDEETFSYAPESTRDEIQSSHISE